MYPSLRVVGLGATVAGAPLATTGVDVSNHACAVEIHAGGTSGGGGFGVLLGIGDVCEDAALGFAPRSIACLPVVVSASNAVRLYSWNEMPGLQ